MGLLLSVSAAQAGWVNGGFEADTNVPPAGWTHKTYTRQNVLPASPPVPNMNTGATLAQLGLINEVTGNANNRSAIITSPATLMPLFAPPLASAGDSSVKVPRWDDHAFRLNDQGSKFASSIEQTTTITADDVDPRDDRVHIRFAMAPIMVDGGHGATQQPYFYVQVRNITKNKVMFYTYNYSTQPGVPWQVLGDYRWTDWQGVDVAPGNGQLDVGDQVQLIVYAANCQPSAAYHEARVYLDAVGVFMPGLSIEAKGPSVTTPGATIEYIYNYINNSPDMTLGSEVYVAAPKTEAGLELGFDLSSIPSNCTTSPVYPSPNPANRGKYIKCEVGGANGQLNPGQGGSFPIRFTVPGGASAGDVINNGDYNIRSNTVSAYIGPMVKTNIVASATPLVDLAVTVDNGGKIAYGTNETATYTVTVTNHGPIDQTGTVTQSLKGMGESCAALTFNPALGAGFTCTNGGAPGDGVAISFLTGSLTTGATASYTVIGTTPGTPGTPVNTTVAVAPTSGAIDSNLSNNTDGLQTPVASNTPNLTVNATGSGSGYVQGTPAALACGNTTPVSGKCTSTTQPVGEGQEVLLYATAHPGSIFTGWTGCTSVVDNICKVTKGASAETVTANFDKAWIVTPAVTGGTSGPAGPSLVSDGGSSSFVLTPTVPGNVPSINASSTCKGTLIGPDGSGNYTYTASPVDADCAFTVNFTPPQANPADDVTNTPPGIPVAIPVLNNDRGDRPLDPASVTTAGTSTPPTKGWVSCDATGVCTYTPNPGQTGTDTFTYKVCLEAPNGAICKEATVTVSISSIGLVAMDDVTNTPQGQAKTIPVRQNDTATGGGAIDPATVAKTSDPSNGTVSCAGGECVYTPNPGFTGTDHFTYKVCLAAPDGAICDEARVTVVVGAAAGPVLDARDDAADTTPGAPVDVPVTANDGVTAGVINPGSVVSTSGPAHGSVDCTTTPGVCRYTPNPGFTGGDSFTYKVCLAAPNGAVCDEATVRVQVRLSPASIPTLSEWGLIILSALMGLFMLGMQHRRRR